MITILSFACNAGEVLRPIERGGHLVAVWENFFILSNVSWWSMRGQIECLPNGLVG